MRGHLFGGLDEISERLELHQLPEATAAAADAQWGACGPTGGAVGAPSRPRAAPGCRCAGRWRPAPAHLRRQRTGREIATAMASGSHLLEAGHERGQGTHLVLHHLAEGGVAFDALPLPGHADKRLGEFDGGLAPIPVGVGRAALWWQVEICSGLELGPRL